jgi:DNA-binding transcriptional ArsR family regulator
LRLQILVLLCQQDLHVNALAERLEMNQSIVSQQLRILRMRDLVAAKRENGFALYSIKEPHVRDIVRCLGNCQAERGVTGP